MKKIKLFIASMIGAIALVFACVFSFGVNAGVVSSENKVQTWSKSDLSGLLQSDSSPASFSAANWSDCTATTWKNIYILIPVPSNAVGKLYVTGTSKSENRKLTLLDTSGATTSEEIPMVKAADAADHNFGSANIITNITNHDGEYFIGVLGPNSDFKVDTIRVTLTTGEYTSQVTVNYFLKDENPNTATPFNSEIVNSGSVATGNVSCWGKDIIKCYTDSACTKEWTNKTVTSDINIFCTYNVWDSSVYGVNGYVLSNSLIGLIRTSFTLDANSKTNISIPNTIYTILGKTVIETTTYNDSTYQVINTGGGLSTDGPSRGVKFQVETAGIIRVTIFNSKNKTLALAKSAADNTIDTASVTSNELSTFEFEVEEAGTYFIGGTSNIKIYDIYFTESVVKTPVLEQQENGTGTAIRFIATVEGITSETQVASWKVIISTAGKTDYVSSSFTDLYTAVTANNAAKDNGKDAADNTLYLVATLKNIPASYNDVTISTKVVVTLNDDNHTILTSNVVTHKIKVTTTTV